MSTSGNYTLSRNRDQILRSALRKVGAFGSGETPDADSVNDAAEALNNFIKHLQAKGIEIWTTGEAILFPQLNQIQYTLSSTSTDNTAQDYIQTTLSADVVNGASSITVDSITGIADDYYIGIQIDDGTLDWNVVSGTPSGSTINLDNPTTDSASEGNLVLAYQSKLVRPLKILSARRHNFLTGIDTPLNEFDRIEYQELPNKTASGNINCYYYDRRGGANNSGILYLWLEPESVNEAVKMTVARPIQVFSSAGDDMDFPEEWALTLDWNLADQLKDEYDVPEPKYSRIEAKAAQYLADVTWNERELTDIKFVPDFKR